MQLTPLQSRLVASLCASLFILALYLLLISPRGAFAAELHFDGLLDLAVLDAGSVELQSPAYEPEFSLFSRSILGRAEIPDTTPLDNDKPLALNVQPGEWACYVVKASTFFGNQANHNSRRASREKENESDSLSSDTNNSTIYVSANTCIQPTKNSTTKTTSRAPQMVLLISNATDAGCPQPLEGPNGVQAKGFTTYTFEEGAITYNSSLTGDAIIAVYAPKLTAGYEGKYNFEIAASSKEYFHQYESHSQGPQLLWMDSDSTSALLLTWNLTDDANEKDAILKEHPPYNLFVNIQDSPSLDGVRRSACGLQHNALIGANDQNTGMNNSLVKTAMTVRGPGGLPKQQFYIVGLNATTPYLGYLVKPANVSVNAKRQDGDGSVPANPGSIVFEGTNFTTSSGTFAHLPIVQDKTTLLVAYAYHVEDEMLTVYIATNCKVVTDLDFCDEIQYAVPGNDDKFNNTELAKAYDKYAQGMYTNFIKVMQQIQCETDNTSRYSLARTCDDCKIAYKRWLCTVSIPRCEDFTGGSTFGMARNVGQPYPNGTKLADSVLAEFEKNPWNNASRNVFIDQEIQPGPYKEILPCEDICYQVVQSCPAQIGFTCPQPGMKSFSYSYGVRDTDDTTVSCNFPGEARTPTGGGWTMAPNLALMASLLMASGLLLVT